jgi:tRNA1(Val) A37 N6-methylase TrmN6
MPDYADQLIDPRHPVGIFDFLRPCVESQLLADFVHLNTGDYVLDVGCGSGYLTLFLAWRFPRCIEVVGVDINQDLIIQATKNHQTIQRRIKRVSPQINFISSDVTALSGYDNSFNVLVSNPPFFDAGAGRSAKSRQRRQARQDVTLTLHDLMHSAARLLKNDGRFYIIIPSMRISELESAVNDGGMSINNIHSCPDIRKRSGGISLIEIINRAQS